MAAYRGQTAVAELLLSKGANIEAANKVTIDFQQLGRILRSQCLDFDDYRDKIF